MERDKMTGMAYTPVVGDRVEITVCHSEKSEHLHRDGELVRFKDVGAVVRFDDGVECHATEYKLALWKVWNF